MSKHKMTPARCQSSHYYVSTSPTLIYGPGWAAGIFWRDQSTSLLPSPPPPLLLTSSSKFIPCPTSSHQTTHSPPAPQGSPAAANVYILPTTVYIYQDNKVLLFSCCLFYWTGLNYLVYTSFRQCNSHLKSSISTHTSQEGIKCTKAEE